MTRLLALALVLGGCVASTQTHRVGGGPVAAPRTIPTAWCYSLVTRHGRVPTADYCFASKQRCDAAQATDENTGHTEAVTACTAVEL